LSNIFSFFGNSDHLQGHVDSILCSHVVNDHVVASGASDSTLRLWDLSGETPTSINVLQVFPN